MTNYRAASAVMLVTLQHENHHFLQKAVRFVDGDTFFPWRADDYLPLFLQDIIVVQDHLVEDVHGEFHEGDLLQRLHRQLQYNLVIARAGNQ